MKDEILFVADLHISLYNRNKSLEHIVDFIEKNHNRFSEIYFLGDTFDFYFPYKDYIPKRFSDFFYTIRKFSNEIKFFIMPGNHDIWLDNFLSENIHFTIIPYEYTLTRFSMILHLMHGDGLFLYKYKNRLMDKILKNKINIKLFSMLHPNIAYKLGDHISFFYTPSKTNDELIEIVKERIKKHQLYGKTDLFVMGHVHKHYYNKNEKLCIIGAFRNKGHYMILNKQGVHCEHI